MKNKKIFLLPLVAFVISACGSDTENEDRGNSDGLPDQVSQATLTFPSDWDSNSPTLNKDNNTFTLRFSTEENRSNNFYISTRRDNPIQSIVFEKEHKEELANYIYNYEQFSLNLERLGDDIMNNGSGQIQFTIEDLPADLYQNIEDMNAERVISEILKLNVSINNGTRLSRDIKFNYKNENTIPELPRFFENSFTFNQSSSNYITIPIEDPNINDKITYSLVSSERLESISIYTDQNCERVEDYELINCDISDEREAIFRVETSSIRTPSIEEVLQFRVTDQSRDINVSEIEGDDEDSPPSIETSFGGLNVVSENLNIIILNSDDDLTPTVNFVNSTNLISERDGGHVNYIVSPAPDRPDAVLSVDYQIDLDGLSINSEIDRENNRVIFNNIDIQGDVERVLRVSVSDGEYSSYNETLIRFVDDINSSPSLSAPNSITINESTGGSISYNANIGGGSSLNISGQFISGFSNVMFEHDFNGQRFIFSDLELDGNQIGVFRITATNGVSTVYRDVEITFNSDINPILSFPSEIDVMEEGENIFSYVAYIENNNQERTPVLEFQINLPDGVLKENLEDESAIVFNTENFRTREDLSRNMRISYSDGVSTIERDVIVNFINNVDKDLDEFMNIYTDVRNNVSQLTSINADRVIFDFYLEFARIKGVNSFEINEINKSVIEINEFEIDLLNQIVEDINDFVDNVDRYDLNPGFSEAYEDLGRLISEKERFGSYIVSEYINGIASFPEINLPILSPENNSFNITGVYGRYIGNNAYGNIISGNRFETSRGYKFIDLVNPRKNVCE